MHFSLMRIACTEEQNSDAKVTVFKRKICVSLIRGNDSYATNIFNKVKRNASAAPHVYGNAIALQWNAYFFFKRI